MDEAIIWVTNETMIKWWCWFFDYKFYMNQEKRGTIIKIKHGAIKTVKIFHSAKDNGERSHTS